MCLTLRYIHIAYFPTVLLSSCGSSLSLDWMASSWILRREAYHCCNSDYNDFLLILLFHILCTNFVFLERLSILSRLKCLFEVILIRHRDISDLLSFQWFLLALHDMFIPLISSIKQISRSSVSVFQILQDISFTIQFTYCFLEIEEMKISKLAAIFLGKFVAVVIYLRLFIGHAVSNSIYYFRSAVEAEFAMTSSSWRP